MLSIFTYFLQCKEIMKEFIKKYQNAFKIIIFFIIFVILAGKLYKYLTETNFQLDAFLTVYGIIATTLIAIVFASAMFIYKDYYRLALAKENLNPTLKKNPLVSFLVAVKDEEELIAQCVDSLVNQTYHNREIIVVNDASTDKTKDILDAYAKVHKDVTIIHLERNLGKKRALAEGILKAKGEIFVFTDSDSILEPDAVDKCVTILNNFEHIGAISGHVRVWNADQSLITKIQDSWYEGQFSVRKAFESIFGAVTCVSGPLAVFRREAIFNYIPAWANDRFLGQEFKFATDRSLTGFVLGSKYIGKKLKKNFYDPRFFEVEYPDRDWKIVYSKAARAWTKVPETLGLFIRQQVRWKKSFIRHLFITGLFFWRKPLVMAIAFYFKAIFVIFGPIVTFRNIVYLPLVQKDIISPLLYLLGIMFVGLMFALAYRIENIYDTHDNKWVYRPLMSILSTLGISWLIYYSAFTIKNQIWRRS